MVHEYTVLECRFFQEAVQIALSVVNCLFISWNAYLTAVAMASQRQIHATTHPISLITARLCSICCACALSFDAISPELKDCFNDSTCATASLW